MTEACIMLELKEIPTAPDRGRALSSPLASAVSSGRLAMAELLMDRLIAGLNRCGPPKTAGPLLLAT